jgi:hypothetical protein
LHGSGFYPESIAKMRFKSESRKDRTEGVPSEKVRKSDGPEAVEKYFSIMA